MTPQADVIESLIALLREDPEVLAVAGDRIYGGRVPQHAQEEMPMPSVVLRYAGGIQAQDFVPLQRPRVDVTYYGRTPQEADSLRRTAHPVLKSLRRRTVSGVLLYSAQEDGGPVAGSEQSTNWPYSFTSWTVLAAEET